MPISGDKPATLTTRPIKSSGENLFVNLAAPQGASRGYVAAGGPGFAGLTDEPRK